MAIRELCGISCAFQDCLSQPEHWHESHCIFFLGHLELVALSLSFACPSCCVGMETLPTTPMGSRRTWNCPACRFLKQRQGS